MAVFAEDPDAAKAGLFSMSPRWFRHSGYEVLEGNRGLIHITPQQNAEIEWYKPFKEFPQILLEFYKLTTEIREMQKNWWEEDKSEEPAVSSQFYSERDRRRKKKIASILLGFVSCYGPFGLFWQDVLEIYPEYIGGHEPDGYRVSLTPSLLTKGQRVVHYDEYARHFFPQLKPPFPVPDEGRQKFLLGYSEPVNYLLAHSAFTEVARHLEVKKEFENSRANIDHSYKDIRGLPWSEMLEIGAWPLGIKLVHEEGKWHLRWQFKTLLDALLIMHMNNIAGTMGQRVKICALPDCHRPHLRKGLYCCSKHTNVAAKRAEREREKQKNDSH
jgi:hypothetical protein